MKQKLIENRIVIFMLHMQSIRACATTIHVTFDFTFDFIDWKNVKVCSPSSIIENKYDTIYY